MVDEGDCLIKTSRVSRRCFVELRASGSVRASVRILRAAHGMHDEGDCQGEQWQTAAADDQTEDDDALARVFLLATG